MEILVRAVQELKAEAPIEVTESGMETCVKLVQELKACSPIEMTEFGIETSDRLCKIESIIANVINAIINFYLFNFVAM